MYTICSGLRLTTINFRINIILLVFGGTSRWLKQTDKIVFVKIIRPVRGTGMVRGQLKKQQKHAGRKIDFKMKGNPYRYRYR